MIIEFGKRGTEKRSTLSGLCTLASWDQVVREWAKEGLRPGERVKGITVTEHGLEIYFAMTPTHQKEPK